jgi:histidyl-tRNA synthetase
MGACYRYERPQSGRYREFYQFGTELIGANNPESDAEVIGLAATIMDRIGLEDHDIRVGHIGILREMLSGSGVDRESMALILQKLDKKMYDEARPIILSAGMDEEGIEHVFRITEVQGDVSILEGMKGEAIEYLRGVFDVLSSQGINQVKVDMGMVRGLDYYTGMVFEVEAPCLGAEKQVCGGGSYSLSELFGGEKVFSTGFAIGFDRVMLALENEGLDASGDELDAFVIPVKDAQRPKAFSIVSELRGAGLSADVDLMRRSMGKNFKHADSSGARRAVIVGEKELEQNSVTVRDMDTGDQTLVALGDLVDFLRGINPSGSS